VVPGSVIGEVRRQIWAVPSGTFPTDREQRRLHVELMPLSKLAWLDHDAVPAVITRQCDLVIGPRTAPGPMVRVGSVTLTP